VRRKIERYSEIVDVRIDRAAERVYMQALPQFESYVALAHGLEEAGGAIQMFHPKLLVPRPFYATLGTRGMNLERLEELEKHLRRVNGVRVVVIDQDRWFTNEQGLDVGGCVLFADTHPRLELDLIEAGRRAGFIFEPRTHGHGAGSDDRDEWSEMNHAFAGLCLLFLTFLGVLQVGMRRPPWLVRYGTVFIWVALFAFLFIRSDRNAWPLGELGWFESFREWETTQHRIGIGLLLLIALGDLMRIRGRLQVNPVLSRWALPVIGLGGSAMLFNHLHTTIDPAHYRLVWRMNVQHLLMATCALGFTLSKFAWDTWQVPRKWGQFLWLFFLGALGVVLILYVE
jgi:hypothetical protein